MNAKLFLGRRIQDFEAIPRRIQINQFVNDCCVASKLLMHDMVLRHWVPERNRLVARVATRTVCAATTARFAAPGGERAAKCQLDCTSCSWSAL